MSITGPFTQINPQIENLVISTSGMFQSLTRATELDTIKLLYIQIAVMCSTSFKVETNVLLT